MTGLLEYTQTSGNHWEVPVNAMLHEDLQWGELQKDPPEHTTALDDLEDLITPEKDGFRRSLQTIKKLFILMDPDGVEKLLRTHRGIFPLILDSLPFFQKCFGSQTLYALETMEEDGPPNAVYMLALWRSDVVAARHALEHFDDLWLMKNFKRANGRIVFDYELI